MRGGLASYHVRAMQTTSLLDLLLHLDAHLGVAVHNWGPAIYGVLFLIVFIETGAVVMPFLPGDSLLFVCGALAGVGTLDLGLVMGLLFVAAVAGDNLNFWIGRRVGARVFGWQGSRLFNRAAFDRTHSFFERYGPLTVIVARFMPFARTFAPFVAGVAAMGHRRFVVYDTIGAVLWVGGIVSLGFLIGNLPWVKTHFSWVALSMIVVPALPALWQLVRHWVRRR